MMQESQIQWFPKIELHCHLDGSISENTLCKIIKDSKGEQRYNFEEIKKKVKAPDCLADLAEYLSCFDYVLPLLQTESSLRAAAYELIRQASLENVIYIEVRFAPLLHCEEELNQEAAVKAVLEGLESGERVCGVKSRVILCMMRGKAESENLITLQCAKELREYGVGGLDLAGNEMAYPPKLYESLFTKALDWDIPFTIHAGECGSAENVRTSIMMGARRIGHGVAIAKSEAIKELCRKKGIVLEMCPVSNIQTGAVKSIGEYPFEGMRHENVAVTINTDNRTVSDTTLTKEWITVAKQFKSVNEAALEKAGLWAIKSAFLSWYEKEALIKEFFAKISK